MMTVTFPHKGSIGWDEKRDIWRLPDKGKHRQTRTVRKKMDREKLKGYNPLKRETRPESRSHKEGGFDGTF